MKFLNRIKNNQNIKEAEKKIAYSVINSKKNSYIYFTVHGNIEDIENIIEESGKRLGLCLVEDLFKIRKVSNRTIHHAMLMTSDTNNLDKVLTLFSEHGYIFLNYMQ